MLVGLRLRSSLLVQGHGWTRPRYRQGLDLLILQLHAEDAEGEHGSSAHRKHVYSWVLLRRMRSSSKRLQSSICRIGLLRGGHNTCGHTVRTSGDAPQCPWAWRKALMVRFRGGHEGLDQRMVVRTQGTVEVLPGFVVVSGISEESVRLGRSHHPDDQTSFWIVSCPASS